MHWQTWLIFAMIFGTFGAAALPHFPALFFGIVAVFAILFIALFLAKKDNNVS